MRSGFRGRSTSRFLLGRNFYGHLPLVGGLDTIVSVLRRLVEEGGFDGVMFCFADFIGGLTLFGERIIPILEQQGLR